MSKIRTDFVSNSSSASFIVYSEDNKVELSELSSKDMIIKMLNKIQTVAFYPKTEKFSDEIIKLAELSGVFELEDNGCISIRPGIDVNLARKELDEIMKNSKSMYCYFGLNDCDEYTAMMGQYGALFEFLGYDIDNSDSETCYPSIKDIL